MTRIEIEADIKKTVGNFPSFSAVAAYLGMSPHTAREFLSGTPSYKTNDGRMRRYFACDIAKLLAESEDTGC